MHAPFVPVSCRPPYSRDASLLLAPGTRTHVAFASPRFTLSFRDYDQLAGANGFILLVETRTWDVLHAVSWSKATFRHHRETQ